MLVIHYKDGSKEEFPECKNSHHTKKYIYFLKNRSSQFVTYVPMDSIKCFEDDHSYGYINKLLEGWD